MLKPWSPPKLIKIENKVLLLDELLKIALFEFQDI